MIKNIKKVLFYSKTLLALLTVVASVGFVVLPTAAVSAQQTPGILTCTDNFPIPNLIPFGLEDAWCKENGHGGYPAGAGSGGEPPHGIPAQSYTCSDGTTVNVPVGSTPEAAQAFCPVGTTPPDVNVPLPTDPAPGGGGSGTSEPIKLSPISSSTNTPCGGGKDKSGAPRKTVTPSIDIGCRGEGNPIYDMITALLRFLSIAVGILMIGSAMVAGIQFAMSGDNPQAKQKAIKRLLSVASAFFVFIMTFAALNFLIPGGLF